MEPTKLPEDVIKEACHKIANQINEDIRYRRQISQLNRDFPLPKDPIYHVCHQIIYTSTFDALKDYAPYKRAIYGCELHGIYDEYDVANLVSTAVARSLYLFLQAMKGETSGND